MYGIGTLMDFIAYESSEADYDNFQEIWLENFQKVLIKQKKYDIIGLESEEKNEN